MPIVPPVENWQALKKYGEYKYRGIHCSFTAIHWVTSVDHTGLADHVQNFKCYFKDRWKPFTVWSRDWHDETQNWEVGCRAVGRRDGKWLKLRHPAGKSRWFKEYLEGRGYKSYWCWMRRRESRVSPVSDPVSRGFAAVGSTEGCKGVGVEHVRHVVPGWQARGCV